MEPKWARFLVRNAQLSTRGFTDDIYTGTSVNNGSWYLASFYYHHDCHTTCVHYGWSILLIGK